MNQEKTANSASPKKRAVWPSLVKKDFRQNWGLYIMILPVLAFYIIFCYVPMYGAIIAFKNYSTRLGILASPWAEPFYKHFQEPMFSKVMKVLEVMDRISADRDNVPLSQIALNWCAQKEFVSSCIVGAQSRRKIEENCAAYQWMLTSEEIALLDAAIEQYLVEQ